MVCTFFGHKNVPSSIKEDIYDAIINLTKEGVREFYVGNNGNFDFWVQKVLWEISKVENITYSIILSRLNENVISDNQKASVFPEGFEKFLPRFAISKRNEWMLKKSNIVITYTKSRFSNCYKWIEKAEKRGLRIINLAK